MLALRCLRKVPLRSFHLTRVTRISEKNVEEVRIPVPWGHIAGKWWGSKDIEPILAIHGWQDNAGSWDPFTSLLPDKYSLLAIDIPGNGLSSHIPPFQNYYFVDSIPIIRIIKSHYGLGQLNLLGHSGGSASCFLYSTIYPEDVISWFGIDYVSYAYVDEAKRAENMGKIIDKKIALALRDPKKSKKYSWDEAKEVWVTGTKGSVSSASAEILMKRGVEKTSDGKFVFSRDHRLKAPDLFLLNSTQLCKLTENIRCNVALVKASMSHLFDQGLKNTPHLLDIVKKNAKSYEFHEINAGHHVHMDMPETILDLYAKFRDKISSL